MYLNIKDSVEKKCTNLTKFLDSDAYGVFYVGHASILVRLNKNQTLELFKVPLKPLNKIFKQLLKVPLDKKISKINYLILKY